MGTPSHIKLSKYLTHTAVWEVTGTSGYGDSSVTSLSTVKCFYFTGQVFKEIGDRGTGLRKPIQEIRLEHQVLLYSTQNVKVGDVIAAITSQDGNVLQAGGRVGKLESYQGWRPGAGLLLQQITLAFD